MATIQKRTRDDGGTSYRVLVRLKGHPTQTHTARTKKDAEAWATRIEAAIREGRALPGVEARRRTVEELVDAYKASGDYLDLSKVERRKRAAQLRWWCEQIGERVLADVSTDDIRRLRDRLTREGPTGRPVANATANRYLAALRAAWTADPNPCKGIRSRKEPTGRVPSLTDDQRAALLDACRDKGGRRLWRLVQWALWTGARQGELLALRWPDVDETRGRAILRDTKNGTTRAAAIPSPLVPVVQEQRKVRRLDTDLVFETTRFPRSAWDSARGAAGLPGFRFHDLRHDFASRLADSGATLPQLAAALGHKTLAMVQRYAHLSRNSVEDAVERMAQGGTT